MRRKIVFLPYDFDTALGINNEGTLSFDPFLTDTDHQESGADVYNGQDSVLWNNVREAFGPELKTMYQSLRTNSEHPFNYAKVRQMFVDHQSQWCEAVFNEDSQVKYLDPYIEDGDATYLPMAQGAKSSQRDGWLEKRFAFRDSFFEAGDALTEVIQLRGYAKSNIVLTSVLPLFLRVRYGSADVKVRAEANTPYTMTCPLDNVNDTEIYVYSANWISSIGDISGFMPGLVDFSKALRITQLLIGSNASGYSNGNLTALTAGNNSLLEYLDVRNCPNLIQAVDLSGCTGLKTAYFEGTRVAGVSFANGGILETVHLPNSIANLTLMNQTKISDFQVVYDSQTEIQYENLSTLRIENCPTINIKPILLATPITSRVRLIGFYWEAEDADEIETLLSKLDDMRGLDENGNNVETAQVSGTIHTDSLTGAQIADYNSRYPHLVVVADHTESTLTYMSTDNTTVYSTETVYDGGNGTLTNNLTKASTAQYSYTANGWSLTPNGETDANALVGVTADRTVYPAFTATVRTYTATFVKASDDGGGTLYTQSNIPYGTTPTYGGSTPTTTKGDATTYPFEGWTPALSGITGNTTYTAVFGSPIEDVEIDDDFETMCTKMRNGTSNYKVGNYFYMDMGSAGIIKMRIVGKSKDVLADDTGNADYTFISDTLLNFSSSWNPSYTSGTIGTGTIGGWENSLLRTYYKNTYKSLIPASLKALIVEVKKYTKIHDTSEQIVYNAETVEDIWAPSLRELGSTNAETEGPTYIDIYPDVSSRIKKTVNGSTEEYWTRSAATVRNPYRVTNTGSVSGASASSSRWVTLGFCVNRINY